MKYLLYLVGVLACGSLHAQESSAPRRDPTAPSAEILKRLTAVAPPIDTMLSPAATSTPEEEIAQVAPAFPELVLKGIVLSDPDHGTALLEAAGRRVTLRLTRHPAGAGVLPAPNAARLSGFCVQGVEFQVLDFSDRTLLLQADDRTVLVQ